MNIEDILGSKIKTIDADVYDPFGIHFPVIVLHEIILEDGRTFLIQGREDLPLLPVSGKEGMDRELIQAAVRTEDETEDHIAKFREAIDDCFD